jgi:hypothetical protein
MTTTPEPVTEDGLTIKRHCYYPHNRPRVWWWKIVGKAGEIVADGFSSKAEAREWLVQHG